MIRGLTTTKNISTIRLMDGRLRVEDSGKIPYDVLKKKKSKILMYALIE